MRTSASESAHTRMPAGTGWWEARWRATRPRGAPAGVGFCISTMTTTCAPMPSHPCSRWPASNAPRSPTAASTSTTPTAGWSRASAFHRAWATSAGQGRSCTADWASSNASSSRPIWRCPATCTCWRGCCAWAFASRCSTRSCWTTSRRRCGSAQTRQSRRPRPPPLTHRSPSRAEQHLLRRSRQTSSAWRAVPPARSRATSAPSTTIRSSRARALSPEAMSFARRPGAAVGSYVVAWLGSGRSACRWSTSTRSRGSRSASAGSADRACSRTLTRCTRAA